MSIPFKEKSTTEEIRLRFDNDVERFSHLETGQTATIDAPLVMDLLTKAAFSCTPNIRRVLDIGCGAGNNTLKLLELASPFGCDLVDLTEPMFSRTHERISTANKEKISLLQGIFGSLIFRGDLIVL